MTVSNMVRKVFNVYCLLLNGEKLVDGEVAAGHDEQYAEPLGPADSFVEDEHGGNHAESVGDAGQRIGLRERIMAQDVHPQHTRCGERYAASQQPPVGKQLAEVHPRPRERRHGLHGNLEQHLSGTEAKRLYQSQ